MEIKTIRIHGHHVGYYAEGNGPALILVHGIASSSRTWRQVIPRLAERFTVIAPDMLGHGASFAEIGQVLRHRAANTTEIYAKVDVNALRALAQPWPGGAQ